MDTVLIEARTFGELVGSEDHNSVYLFRVSEEFLSAVGDDCWKGPVMWRIIREPGRIVSLELRQESVA